MFPVFGFLWIRGILSRMKIGVLFFAFLITQLSHALSASERNQTVLETELINWVVETLDLTHDQITVASLNANVQVQRCEEDLLFAFPFNNYDTVRVSCGDTWQLFLRISISDSDPVFVANQDIKAGSPITPRNVVPVDPSDSDTRIPFESEFAARDLKAGEVVTDRDVSAGSRVYRVTRAFERGEIVSQNSIESVIGVPDLEAETPILEIEDVRLIAKRSLATHDILVESNVARLSSVIATARALPHGKVIETEDLQIVWIPVDTLQRNHIRSVDEVVGLQTTRQIAPLQHIRRTDLTQALLVKKGDAVTLRISRGAMTIEMDAIAAESGAFGDQITVVNPNSGKRIRATVVSKNLVAGI